ncbi:hypothetical protein L9F63_023767, partial [Diploptera punctata]
MERKRSHYKRRAKQKIEDKDTTQEVTPPRCMVPQTHSTPTAVIEISSESESEDTPDNDMCFTQDQGEVQWDYSNTPVGKDKKKNPKKRKKCKAVQFGKNERKIVLSPLVRVRRINNKDKPKDNMNECIPDIEVFTNLVEEQK